MSAAGRAPIAELEHDRAVNAPSSSVERLVAHLRVLRARLPHEPSLVVALETTCEALYVLVDGTELAGVDTERPLELENGLAAWLRLFELRALSSEQREVGRARLFAALSRSPAYTRLLVGGELVRLESADKGPVSAWTLAQELALVSHFGALGTLPELQRDGPMLGATVVLLVGLAASNGAFDVVQELERRALTLWARASPQIARIQVACADADIPRGEYVRALERITRCSRSLPDDAQLRAACIELHALVALGEGTSDIAVDSLRRCAEHLATPEPNDTPGARAERAELHGRVRWLAATNFVLAGELGGSIAPPARRAPATWSTQDLFILEGSARRLENPARRRELELAIIERTEQHLHGAGSMSPDQELRLRLLWCRLVVALNLTSVFEFCDTLLSAAVDRSRALRSRALEMIALDQRCVLRARRAGTWTEALVDSSAAAEIACELLELNPPSPGAAGFRRSYLEDLLPVFDRVIELYAESAGRVAALPGFNENAVNPFDLGLFLRETPEGSYQRFGRGLHAFAERAQALGLAEARRARDELEGSTTTLPPVVRGEPQPVLAALAARLRSGDAIVQYFLIGSYVLIFAYGSRFFRWHLGLLQGEISSEKTLAGFIDDLRGWIQGIEAVPKKPAFERLNALLMPRELTATLLRAHVRHLRIVPHGALYRLPFGRLTTDVGPLGVAFSTSLHPTGEAAAEAALPATRRLPGRARFAHVVGPEKAECDGPATECVAVAGGLEERAAMERGVGSIAPPAVVRPLDAWRAGLVAVQPELSRCELLHFSCHGQEGNALGASANMLLDPSPKGELSASAVARLDLRSCALVVLQSCWTGWLHHTRTRPVQGFPQAFCDAGSLAVIAPLTQVPAAITPIFTDVFYRSLRFLSAEMALRRTLGLLRKHGRVLVRRGGTEAMQAFEAWGMGFDALEYRYTGASAVRFGTWLSRWIGRVAFYYFEWTLRRT